MLGFKLKVQIHCGIRDQGGHKPRLSLGGRRKGKHEAPDGRAGEQADTASRTTDASARFPGSRAALGKGACRSRANGTPRGTPDTATPFVPSLAPPRPRVTGGARDPSSETLPSARPGGAGELQPDVAARPSPSGPAQAALVAQSPRPRVLTPAALPFRKRPPGTRAARAPPRSASRGVSGGCRRASALRRVSGGCRPASASRLVSGGVGGPRPLGGSPRLLSAWAETRAADSLRKPAGPASAAKIPVPGRPPGLSLPPETHSSAPRQPRPPEGGGGGRKEEGGAGCRQRNRAAWSFLQRAWRCGSGGA